MSRTIRVIWNDTRTGWKNFNWRGVIDEFSTIHISASEGEFIPQIAHSYDDPRGMFRKRGAALIQVKNIRPHGDEGGGGGVEFYLEVDWWDSLTVVTDISVLDPPVQGSMVPQG